MLFLYWPNTILPYKMAAVEQETYGNKLAPHVVYRDERCYFQVGFVPTKTEDSAFKASLSDSSLMSVSYTMMGGHIPRTYSPSADALYQAPNVCH